VSGHSMPTMPALSAGWAAESLRPMSMAAPSERIHKLKKYIS